MKEELNDDSNKIVAKRFNVSPITIKHYIDLLKSPSKYYDVWGWGASKVDGRISWSQFREACDFFEKKLISEDDFGILVNGVLNEQMPPSNIREIVRLKKKNPDKSFKECYQEILNTVPKTIKSIIFIADIDYSLLGNIRLKATKKSISEYDEVKSTLAQYLGSKNVEDLIIKDDKYIKIALTEQGRKNLGDIAQKDSIALVNIINHIFIKAGYNHG